MLWECFLSFGRRPLKPAPRETGRTLEDPHGSGEVVDPPGGVERSGADGRRGDEIVGEGVVQVALLIEAAWGPTSQPALFFHFFCSCVVICVGRAAVSGLGIIRNSPGAQRRPAHCRTPSRICDGGPSLRQRPIDHLPKKRKSCSFAQLTNASDQPTTFVRADDVIFVLSILDVSLAWGETSRCGVGSSVSHLALNSSKDSSWCSDRRRDEVLKVGRATTRGRATAERRVVARKKEVAGPRLAIRRRDIFWVNFLGGGWEGAGGGCWCLRNRGHGV